MNSVLPRCLNFLAESKLSRGFRDKSGPDMVFHLLDEDAINEVPNIPGVYIIIADDGTMFQYPNGKSPVMYIGMSTTLQTRLKDHASQTRIVNNDIDRFRCMDCQSYQRYHYFRVFRAKVYVFTRRGIQSPKSQESFYIGKFYEKYLSLPVSNGARSFY